MTEVTYVRDLMHKVHTVRENDTLRDAHGIMHIVRIRHLPVVDDDGKLLGIVSDRDVHRGWTISPETPLSQVMSRSITWVHPATSARDAAARLLENKVGCLPVVDDDHRLVGIVTETDFLELAERALSLVDALCAQSPCEEKNP